MATGELGYVSVFHKGPVTGPHDVREVEAQLEAFQSTIDVRNKLTINPLAEHQGDLLVDRAKQRHPWSTSGRVTAGCFGWSCRLVRPVRGRFGLLSG